MDEYTLYLDESTTHNHGYKNLVFCLAGIIIKNSDYPILQQEIVNLKLNIWHDLPNPSDIIFHEKEIREAQNRRSSLANIKPHFHRFRSNQYSRMLYDGFSSLLKTFPSYILGAVIQKDGLNSYFPEAIQTDQYLTAMQIILENFSQFLANHNGMGHVVFESRAEADKNVRLRYNHIKAMGTMYISPFAMQTLLKDIAFPSKLDNVEGLQLADFVPNPFARHALGKQQHQFNIYRSLRQLRYDGKLSNYDRFGVKIMP